MNFARDDLSSGRIPGITTTRDEMDEISAQMMSVIELCADIRAKIFAAFMQFLYTGIDAVLAAANVVE